MSMTDNMKKNFADYFGDAEGARIFFAPGRVNLIGEHTDYNGGLVFPAALSFGTYAMARARQDGIYRLRSVNFDVQVDCNVGSLVYDRKHNWANYPLGVLQQLIRAAGDQAAQFSGADIVYYGNIPNSAGLSSSASIEVVSAYAFSQLACVEFPIMDLVKLSQAAENQFVGVNCGIMDQFAVGMGKKEHAVMLNCADLSYTYAPLKLADYKLVIANTNKRRGLADSKYNERRAECEEGLRILRESKPELNNLGQIQLAEWESLASRIQDPRIRNRVEHVVAENDRVQRAVKALYAADLQQFGQLMIQSHESLRDLYEVTGHELDTMVEAALRMEGCMGSRMTGAGFGGCTVSLVREDQLEQFQSEVAAYYHAQTGLTATFYVADIGDGVKELGEV